MRIFSKLFLICCLFSFKSYAATVTAASSVTGLNFGKVAAGTVNGGTVASGCGATTGGVVKLAGCQNGSFTVTATNTSTATYGRSVKIYLTPSPTTLTGPGGSSVSSAFTISSPLPAGCVAEDTGIRCTNTVTTNGASKIWTIPIYGALSAIDSTETPGSYSGNFTVLACSCCTLVGTPAQCTDTLCPTTPTNYKCTNAALFKSFSGTFPLTIATPLSIVENNSLRFGAVASGVSSGTVNQSGSQTGGVTALNIQTRSAGKFTVTGETGGTYNYTFTLPSTVTLSCDTGVTAGCSSAPNMTSTLSFATGTSARTIVSGQDVVNINGTLTIGANQAQGNYKGTYAVTVNY